jgi:hypothetical protein
MCGQTISLHDLIGKLPEGGHAPAERDTRWPRMSTGGAGSQTPRMGGKPSKGTRKDKRLKKNKEGK